MSTMTYRCLLLLVAGLALPVCSSVQAQQGAQPTTGRIQSAFEFGARLFTRGVSDPARGGFELYNQYREGPVLEAMRFEHASLDRRTRFILGGNSVTERDQNLWFRATVLRSFDLQLQWDRVVHTYGTTARYPGPTLSSPRPDADAFNAFPISDPVRILWDPVKLGFQLQQSDQWDLSAEYTWLEKSGNRPLGMAFGSPGGNHREILEPIDQTTHQLRITEAYASDRFMGTLTYNLSRFVNHETTLVADNPLETADRVGAGASGRHALAPSNVAHTITATGALQLPSRTRVSGAVSYSWRRQNVDFIPATRNTAISEPVLSQFPASLEGDVRTVLVNLTARTVVAPRLTVSGRFRHFELQDKTADVILPGDVRNDANFRANEHERHRYPYTKDNASLLASWRLSQPVKIAAGYGWESWERAAEIRNVRRTDEHTPHLVLDVTPAPWLLVRTTGSLGWRRGRDDYQQVTDVQLAGLRRFDQADRDRMRLDVLADVGLTDLLTLTGSLAWARDTFPDSDYGTQRVWSSVAGAEVTWTPTPRVTADVSYMREEFKIQQRSRARRPPDLLENITYDWVSNNNDLIETFGIGMRAVAVPDRLEIGGRFEVSDAVLATRTFNPLTPSGGPDNRNAEAVAVDFPDITDKRTPVSGWIRYRFSPEWSAMVQYTYDKWSNADWRTDNVLPANPNSTDRFLGNDYLGYNGQFVTVSFAYRPSFLRAGRFAL